MPPRRTLPVTVILAAALLSACTPPSAPAPAPTPTPTFSCVPEAGGDPVPCGPIEYEQSQKRDALYAEAEGVFRRYWAELDKLTLDEAPSFTDELSATTAGPFAEGVRGLLDPERHVERVSGEAHLARLGRLPGLSKSGSTVALLACVDASRAEYVVNKGDTPIKGAIYEQRVYLAPTDGHLKLVDSELRDVESC